jgi:hypothetical protein
VNFSATSFDMSNDGLCGAPRLHVPPCEASDPRPKNTAAAHILKYALPTIGLTMLVVTRFSLNKMPKKEYENSNGGKPITTSHVEKNFPIRTSTSNRRVQCKQFTS